MRESRICAPSVVAFLLTVSAASAATLSDVLFRVEVQSSAGSGVFEATVDDGSWDGNIFTWAPTANIDVTDAFSRQVLAIVHADATSLYIDADPIMGLNFAVSAGASDTIFTISSPLLSFPAISSAVGRASAGVSITDQNGDGVTRIGGYASGTESYRADYNGLVPSGTLLQTILDNDAAGPFDTSTSNEEYPSGGGFVPLAGAVSSMSSQFKFELSALDSAAGTSVFVVLPEPGTFPLLMLVAASIVRRRWAADA